MTKQPSERSPKMNNTTKPTPAPAPTAAPSTPQPSAAPTPSTTPPTPTDRFLVTQGLEVINDFLMDIYTMKKLNTIGRFPEAEIDEFIEAKMHEYGELFEGKTKDEMKAWAASENERRKAKRKAELELGYEGRQAKLDEIEQNLELGYQMTMAKVEEDIKAINLIVHGLKAKGLWTDKMSQILASRTDEINARLMAMSMEEFHSYLERQSQLETIENLKASSRKLDSLKKLNNGNKAK